MKPYLPALFLICLLTFSFHKKQDLVLTFKNASDENFTQLLVNIRGKEFVFHDLQKGGSTKPIHVKESYRYCYARAVTSKDTVMYQPIDFVGETLVTSGKLLIIFDITGTKGARWLKSSSKVE